MSDRHVARRDESARRDRQVVRMILPEPAVGEVQRFFGVLEFAPLPYDVDDPRAAIRLRRADAVLELRAADAGGEGVRPSPLTLVVDNLVATASRCWDAGYSVLAEPDHDGEERLVVVGPVGCQVALVARDGSAACA